MVAYTEAIIKPLLGRPEQLRVNLTTDEMGTLVTVSVAPTDMGRVIGKNGETAKAIRHLVKCVGVLNKTYAALKINEPEKPNVGT